MNFQEGAKLINNDGWGGSFYTTKQYTYCNFWGDK